MRLERSQDKYNGLANNSRRETEHQHSDNPVSLYIYIYTTTTPKWMCNLTVNITGQKGQGEL